MLNVGTLGPVVALAAWTMVMWIWMYATRFPAMTKAGVDPEKLSRENTASGLDAALPPEVQWKAHNYNHLHEAPTVFYAVALALALVGAGDGLAAILAWTYVLLRVAHSIVQATVHKVVVRFMLFALSSLTLMGLVVLAAIAVF